MAAFRKQCRQGGARNRTEWRDMRGTIVDMDKFATSETRVAAALYVGTVYSKRAASDVDTEHWALMHRYMCDVRNRKRIPCCDSCEIGTNAKRLTDELMTAHADWAQLTYKRQFTLLIDHWFNPCTYQVRGWDEWTHLPFHPPHGDGESEVAASSGRAKAQFEFDILITEPPPSETRIDRRMQCAADVWHADLVLKLGPIVSGLLSTVVCSLCDESYSKRWYHKCAYKCSMCESVGEHQMTARLMCNVCNRTMANAVCFDAHIANGVCAHRRKCPKCKYTYVTGNGTHKCRTRNVCNVCKKAVTDERQHRTYPTDKQDFLQRHQFDCYVPSYTPKTERREKFLVFDIETEQYSTRSTRAMAESDSGEPVLLTDEILAAFRHKVVCICVQQFCRECMHTPVTVECDVCTPRSLTFYGPAALNAFSEWLYSNRCRGRTVFAHNFGRFDATFLTKWLIDHNFSPQVVSVGMRTVKLRIPKFDILMLDSINYLPFPLAALAKSFAKGVELKGFFPFLYPVPTGIHSDHVDDGLPDRRFYCTAAMSTERLQEFERWYAEHKHEPFCYRAECIKYCMNDVDILRVALITFMNMFEKICNGMCCWANGCTLSSIINNFYRAYLMPPDSIPIIANNEQYHRGPNQSRIAITWLRCMAEYHSITIRHARNGGEIVLAGGYPTDGVSVDSAGRVRAMFCFDGCLWHGCVRCYTTERDRILFGTRTIAQLRERTVARDSTLSRKYPGAQLIVRNTCQFKDDLAANARLRVIYERVSAEEHLYDMDEVTPLNCRDSYFGGRSETFALKFEAGGHDDEEIAYVDLCSAYPYALRECTFGVGHPTIVSEGFPDFTDAANLDFYGFVKCRILAPNRGLAHYAPLLPLRIDGRLYFALCHECARLSRHNTVCTHDIRERSWVGTFTALELKLAVEVGYRILTTFEMWRWPRTMTVEKTYDPATGKREIIKHGLYSEYVNLFLRIKHMAAGFPAHIITDAQKQAHVDQLFAADGIRLSIDEVVADRQMYILAKLALNAFYGKLAQRPPGKAVHEYVKTKARFDELNSANGRTLDIRASYLINTTCMHFLYSMRDSHLDVLPHTCVAHASYVTAMTRCTMYAQLSKLNKRVLACDTDSIMYYGKARSTERSARRDWYERTFGADCYYSPPLGRALGDWSNEFPEAHRCFAGYSTGPKSYCLQSRLRAPPHTALPATVRSKGIRRTSRTERDMNGEAYRSLVMDTKRWLDTVIPRDNQPPTATRDNPARQPVRMIAQTRFIKTIAQQMYTRECEKTWRCTFNKRMLVREGGIVSDFTWPFGHLDAFTDMNNNDLGR